MKKTFSILLALTVITSVAFGYDNAPASSTGLAVVKSGSTFKVYYKGTTQSYVKLALYDSKNHIVFTEVFRNTDGFIRPYNFSNLPEGDYKLAITDETGRHEELLSYRQEKVKKIASVISMAGENGKYIISVANRGKDALRVKVLDKSSNVLFEHSENINNDYARIYNLQQLKEKFMLEISDSNGVITTYRF